MNRERTTRNMRMIKRKHEATVMMLFFVLFAVSLVALILCMCGEIP